jgi:hypothetical protein
MKKLTIIAAVALVLLVVVDVALGYFLTGLATKPTANRPAYSVAASKARGAYIESVTFEPSSFKCNGRQIVIKEAWLEHQTELVHIYVIVPFVWDHYEYRQVGGYNFCFNLEEASYPLGDLFFAEQGKGSGFGMLGSVVLWESLDDLETVPAKILATTNWKFENSQVLSVKRGQK